MRRIHYGKCPSGTWWMVSLTRWRTADPWNLRTACIQRLRCTIVWKSIFVFLAISYLCISYASFFKKQTKILLTCIITHTHRRQYSKQVCVLFGKSWVKDKNQRTDNFFLLLFCFLFLVKIPERPGLQAPQTSLLILTNWHGASRQTQELLKTFLWWDNGQQLQEGTQV